jgi:hypothetical protein
MRITGVLFVVLALAACNTKKNDGGGGGSGSGSGEMAKPVEKPIACPAGQVDQNGTCVTVITPQKVQAVAQQQTRIDELAKLLDQVDVAAAPIEIMNGLRQLDQWKAFAATNDRAKLADEVVATVDNAIKTLRAFKANLGEVSARLGNLKGELQRILDDPATARRLDEVRTQVSAQLKTAIEPYAAQTADTLQNALSPLVAKLEEISAIVDIACGTVRLSGGDKAKSLCKDAKTAFANSTKFVDDFKVRPAALFDDVTKTLETELELLVDAGTKQLIDTAQAKVNEALKLPPGGP